MKTRHAGQLRQISQAEQNTPSPSSNFTGLHLRSSNSLKNKVSTEKISKSVTDVCVKQINIYHDENSNDRKNERNFPKTNLEKRPKSPAAKAKGQRTPKTPKTPTRKVEQSSVEVQVDLLLPSSSSASPSSSQSNVKTNQKQSESVPEDSTYWQGQAEALQNQVKQLTIDYEVLETKANKQVDELEKRDEKIKLLGEENELLLKQIDAKDAQIGDLEKELEEAITLMENQAEGGDLDDTVTE